MKDMKMKTKMIIGFTIPIILAIINVVLGISSVRSITNNIIDMQEDEFVVIKQTMEDIGAGSKSPGSY